MRKLFVLDTSILLFDHNAINNFEDNDIAIPITVLEELDRFKIGNDSTNFEARNAIRILDRISTDKKLDQWIKLGPGKGRLKIVMDHKVNGKDATVIFGSAKNDHKIINSVISLAKKHTKTEVCLVTKDINLRIKAKAIGVNAEDYKTGKVEDAKDLSDTFNSAIYDVDAETIKELYAKKKIPENGLLKETKLINGYYVLNNCSNSALARFDGKSDHIELVEKQYAFGIKPRNAEQTFALNALFNDSIKLIALQGVAGTGKTLLALAAALEQKGNYDQIILSRPTIPLGNRDIGFLPGSAEEKVSPYMMPLWDNLKVIRSNYNENSKKSKLIQSLQENGDLSITALNFIRGRSLTNVMFIVDEAQNLTPHEIKTIITRAGEGTKIIFTGDINQIDTPYLDENSNGLTYIIDKLKGNELFAYIKLEKGERSELADLANRLL
ncbi:MAG: PhoH family protein [Bacteroidota bacterium]